MPRRLAPLIALGLAAAAAAWLLVRPSADAESVPPDRAAAVLPVEVQVVEVQTGYEVTAVFAGRLVARRTSVLGFERSGRLAAVAVDDGDRIEAGQVLARLDVRALEARRRELAAQVEETEARLALAGLTAERRQRLHADEALSAQARDEAVHERRALAARLEAGRAALQHVDVELDLSVLRAPYPGLVVERHADEGAVVSPGEPMLEVREEGVLEAHVGVSPEAASDLAPGAEREIRIAGRSVPAVVRSRVDHVEPDTRTVRVVLELQEAPPEARPGALVRLPVSDRVAADGFWLPVTALAESRRGLWSVYAVVPEAESADPREAVPATRPDSEHGSQAPAGRAVRVERRQVDLLHAGAERVFARGTLRDGERVVATGIHRLVPGQRVRPLSTGAGTAE